MRIQARWLLIALILVLAVGVGYQVGQMGHRSVTAAGGAQVPQGWRAHQDPMGFAVSVPRGWEVRPDRASGRVEIHGTQREQVVVWPVFIPLSMAAEQRSTGARRREAVPLRAADAAPVMEKLSAKLWAGAIWDAPQAVSPATFRRHGRVGDRLAVAVFNWVTSPKGTAGCLYATAAPEAHYREAQETFASILRSFRVTGVFAAPQTQPPLNYRRWHDPRENAFSLEVPNQWRVDGGLFRHAAVDTRSAVEAVSPDGQIRITLGDAEIPPFTEPTPVLEMTGFREGSWYSPGYGVKMMVRRYVPGTAFAVEQVRNKIARGCSELSLAETRDRPDTVKAINAVYAQYGQLGIIMRLTAGEIAFTCRRGNSLMQGYYFAATQLTRGQGIGLWSAPHLGGYLATVEQAGQAQAALEHMVRSVELNPQWVAMQSHLTRETSRIASQTSQEISSMMNDSYWRRQGVMDELDRRRSNVILGVEDVIDPATGREFKVESGSSYYWIDHRGSIVGTDTDTRPNLDFRELIMRP